MSKFCHLLITILSLFVSTLSLSAQNCKVLTADGILSSNNINQVVQTSDGTIWVATENGLNRYDGIRAHIYNHDSSDSHSIADDLVRVVIEDSERNIIIGTQSGVQIYDRNTDSFSEPIGFSDGTDYSENVNAIIERDNGDLWVSGNLLMKMRIDKNGNAALDRLALPIPTELTGQIIEDSEEGVWVAKFNDGIYHLSKGGSFRRYEIRNQWTNIIALGKDDDDVVYAGTERGLFRFEESVDNFVLCDIPAINESSIYAICGMSDGSLCLGTDDKGALYYTPESGSVSAIEMNDLYFNTSKLKIHSIIQDQTGNLWFGAYQKGLIIYPTKRNEFFYIGPKSKANDIIGSCSVTSLLIDPDNHLWVGTDNDGLYILNNEHNQLKHIGTENGAPGTIFGLTLCNDSYIYFGSYNEGLWRVNQKTFALENISVGRDRLSIYEMVEDPNGVLWIASMGDGLLGFDTKSKRWKDTSLINESISQWIDDAIIAEDGTLLLATYAGIYNLDISGETVLIKKRILPKEIIYCMFEDQGNLYVGTTNGFYIVDNDGKSRHFTTGEGLPNNCINEIRVDGLGKVWLSTNSGLACFAPETGTFSNFFYGDGIQGNEFSRNASTTGIGGMLFFGGNNGISCFYPTEIIAFQPEWSTKITELSLADGSIVFPEGNRYKLKYDAHSCTIEFATAEYNTSEGTVFDYSINGGPWTTTMRNSSSITMNNLKPGTYAISIRAVSNGFQSNPTTFYIDVAQPWWWTTSMKVLYFILGLLILGIIGYLTWKGRKTRSEIILHKKTEEINNAKLQFFVNLSHELRTPMTLIEGPLNKLLETDKDPERQSYYELMSRCSKRVLLLVNQMLDIRKIDQGKMKLHFVPMKLSQIVESSCNLFREQAAQKGVTIDFRYSGLKDMEVWVDPYNFDKIIVNLLSNAIKFSPTGGRITVIVSNDGQNAQIDVKDEGPGMKEEDLNKVFERFYQGGNQAGGTGIGLNLSQMLTELHHGTIKAANNVGGPGSTFTVTIPLGNTHLTVEEMEVQPSSAPAPAIAVTPDPISAPNPVPTPIPVVEESVQAEEPTVVVEQKQSTAKRALTPDERLLKKVHKIICDNIDNRKLTVEMVANEIGISRVHLHRKIKELTDLTSGDYIRNIRLEKAAEMLAEKDYSSAELTKALGFASTASFNSAFTEHYGVSPADYRKSHTS